ncbi:MAG: folylpolyglutamate synthase/dihydrofolate synthase family protein [Candidatus Kaelpia aquatica]|nr:folylpolyglutamate synthase/dihydrofolate synthase family protein [Candidatus Kaelpia aquatica]
MNIKDYTQAIDYLKSFFNLENVSRYNYSRELKLERMKDLLEKFNNPQDSFKAVHVAGSKGKGTVSASLFQIFKESGYKVGLYTSPHLLNFRERIRVSTNKTDDPIGFGDTISEEDLVRVVSIAKPIIEEFSSDSRWGKPTFFEIYTLVAFLYFKDKNLDLAIIEVGLGGRLDATNVMNSILTIITKIVFEHTDKLGEEITQITDEKCGILKEGIPCVLGVQKWTQVVGRVKDNAGKKSVPLHVIDEDIELEEKDRSFSISFGASKYINLKTNLLGHFQYQNLALSVAAAHLLSEDYPNLSLPSIRSALSDICWPGRMQLIKKSPVIILDSAHTPESVELLGDELKRSYPDRDIVSILAISSDKDKRGIIDQASKFSSSIIFTRALSSRLSYQEELIDIANELGLINYSVEYDFECFMSKILNKSDKKRLYLIAGSIFLVSKALEVFKYGALQTR